MTKTFFSFGNDEAPQSTDKKLLLTQMPDGSFYPPQKLQDEPPTTVAKTQNRRSTKILDKRREKERRQLLVNLFPYIDESKLLHNVSRESGILNFWEDEHLDFHMNQLKVDELGLITPQKEHSFKQQLSVFQNSVLVTQDQYGKPIDSIIDQSELIEKSLLLLQGIPSSGVFDLDQESFTFSMNGKRKVYVKHEYESFNPQPVRLQVNQVLFDDLMEAGSYFLHLKEFVDCMQADSVGKIL